MGVDTKLLCLTCKTKTGGWRFHYSWQFAKKISGKVTEQKIKYLRNIEKRLEFIFGDDYAFSSAKDYIRFLREFLEKHRGHYIIVTYDHDPSEYIAKDGTPDWEFDVDE